MRNGLEGCKGSPTFFFDSKKIIPEVKESIATLKQWLEQAGVTGLTIPDDDEIDAQVGTDTCGMFFQLAPATDTTTCEAGWSMLRIKCCLPRYLTL